MAGIETLSIALPLDMAAELRAAVADGGYASVSDVVAEALREWRLRRDEVRRMVQEGIDSGPGLDGDALFAELRSRFEALRPA